MGWSLLLSIIFFCNLAYAQTGGKDFNLYRDYYPIAEPASIGFVSSYRKDETILFEANPRVRYSFYNDVFKYLSSADMEVDSKPKEGDKCFGKAFYIGFNPQLRMYTDNSLPVRMPSYQVLLGTQYSWLQKGKDRFNSGLWSVALESGHYSNGQAGCAFAHGIDDGTAKCDSVYATITDKTKLSDKLNRIDANFSTNLTKFVVGYRLIKQETEFCGQDRIWNFQLGYLLYHDRFLGLAPFGGYSEQDIKIYGAHRFSAKMEWSKVFGKGKIITLSSNTEWIVNPHASVNPFREELVVSLYPFIAYPHFGFFLGGYFGHDNYNFRFVDSGSVATFGICWTAFQPLKIGVCK